MRKCSECNEEIEDQFDECWRCAGVELLEDEKKDISITDMDPTVFMKNEKVIICESENDCLLIDPMKHAVDNPYRARKRYPKEGLIISALSLGFTLFVTVLYFTVFPILIRIFAGAGPAPRVIMGGLLITLFFGGIYGSMKGIQIALFRPNIKTPESSLQTFFDSISLGLYERAYNLLTDAGQADENIAIHDKDSFEKAWVEFSNAYSFIDYDSDDVRRIDISDSSVLLFVPLFFKDKKSEDKKVCFESRFLFLKMRSAWFLANGFICQML